MAVILARRLTLSAEMADPPAPHAAGMTSLEGFECGGTEQHKHKVR